MKSGEPEFHCTATLTANEGRERLATRSFSAVDTAADWAMATAGRLKTALGGAYGQVEQSLGIVIEGRLSSEQQGRATVVFQGTLAEAEAGLAGQIEHFRSILLPRIRANATERQRAKRSKATRTVGLFAGVAAFAAVAYGVYLYVPPFLDPDRAAEAILSRPPADVVGRWALGRNAANCETNYVEFAAGRYEAMVGGNRQRFAAAYSQPSDDSMRVEYAEGGIRLAQVFKRSAETGRLTIVSVQSSMAEIENAAKRAVGTQLTKCPEPPAAR
ncbi:MAG: hypothetical protein GC202_10770 [Alphaproteobacteria bacterium]|nr:hypothetical protein [Alphaproteobacteria bacterium]